MINSQITKLSRSGEWREPSNHGRGRIGNIIRWISDAGGTVVTVGSGGTLAVAGAPVAVGGVALTGVGVAHTFSWLKD
jgi:hypothetical protein